MRRKNKNKKIVKRRKTKTKRTKPVSGDRINRSYVLQKTDVNRFLNSLLKDFSIVGAKLTTLGDYMFSYIHAPEELVINYSVTTNTIKEFLFPRREELFEFRKTKNQIKILSAKGHPEKPVIFFGIHSCDARAVNFHDRFFAQEPRDSYYWRKRNNAILISIACNKPPKDNCFCNITSGGPFLKEKEVFDIQLIDLGLLFLVECNSQEGQLLIKRHKHCFHKSVETNIQEQENLKNKCLQGFLRHYNLSKMSHRLSTEDFSKLWQALSYRCQECAGCEFICPSCFCFYTQELPTDSDTTKRIRAWDSCIFSGFTKLAGGNNPYGRLVRVSRRFYCKLFNSYKWFNMSGCVGCGRCSFVCPVNLDMESFIASLSEFKNEQKYKPLLRNIASEDKNNETR